MQFITLSIAALSLGSSVLAAPASLISSAGSVASIFQKKAECPVPVIAGSVTTLKASVQVDLTHLTTAIAVDVTKSVVPQVENALVGIALALNDTILTIVPTVIDTVTDTVIDIVIPLAIDEVEALITVIGDLKTLVLSIEKTLGSLVRTVGTDVVVLITPELTIVLDLIMPLVAPVTRFATSVAVEITGSSGTAAQLVDGVSGLHGAVASVLSPVTGVLSKCP